MAIDSLLQPVQRNVPSSPRNCPLRMSDAVINVFSVKGDSHVANPSIAYWGDREVSQSHPTTVLSVERVLEHRKGNFLRRITDDGWSAILQKIEKLNHSISSEELAAFRLGTWTHPVFDDIDWIYFAFQAYLEDKLELDTMCKLFLYNACQKQVTADEIGESDSLKILASNSDCFSVFNQSSGFETFQLLNSDGEFDVESVNCLRASTEQYLDDREFQVFLKLLSELPPEQTQFFIIQREYDSGFEAIRKNVGWPLFITYLDGPEDPQPSVWQTVASPEFVYRMHQARFGENAIRPSPSLGYSEIENLSHPRSRVVSIPSFVPLPSKLHNLSAQPLTFYHHDIVYHHAIESANMHRPVWIAFAKFLKEKREDWIFRTTLDRELLNYVEERKDIPLDNFWIGLPYHLEAVIATIRTEKVLSKEDEIEYRNRFLDLFSEFYFKNYCELASCYDLELENFQQFLLRRVKDPLLSPKDFDFLQSLYMFLEERNLYTETT